MDYHIALKKLVPVVFLFTSGAATFAQVQPGQGKAEPQQGDLTEEIEVIRAYKPVLADAVKIRRSPDLENSKPFKASLIYTIPDLKLGLDADIKKLQAQQLADEQDMALRNNYVAAGAGTMNTGFGEIYLNTGKDEALQAGVFFKHLNQEGSTSGNFMRELFGAYGRSIQNTSELTGNLGFSHTSFNFYGSDPLAATPPPAAEKQRYNVLTLNGSIKSRGNDSGQHIDYHGGAHAHMLKNAFDGSESAFALDAGAGKRAGSFYFGAKVAIDLTGTSDTGYSISNVIMKANPYVSYQGDKFRLTAGLAIYRETYLSRTNVLPDMSAEVELVPGFATLYGSYSGSVIKTSLLDLSEENRHLDQNIAIRNALQRNMISAGFKGNAGSGLGYRVGAWYKTVEDLPLFINSPADIRKFMVVYDESTEILGFEGEVSITSPGAFKLMGKITAADYSTTSEDYAWSKPNLQIWSNASFFINDKLTINGEVLMSSGSKVLAFTPLSPGPGYMTKLGGFTDLSAGAEYRIRQKAGLFLRVNNLLDQRYERYQYYTVNGLNVFGGLNYSF
jgi:hypothetical protein